MNKMIANCVLMVRPTNFGFNPQAAETNSFQNRVEMFSDVQIQEMASLEFDRYVEMLRAENIEVIVFQDTQEPFTPDSIFPNNWISTCPYSKKVYTYPMRNENRAAERREDVINAILEKSGYKLDQGLLQFEQKELYLEGTGSLVLDNINRIAYAAISPRTNQEVLEAWAKKTEYDLVPFKAYGKEGELIYHTNVMMCVADEYVVICLDSIYDVEERESVIEALEDKSHKQIIEISTDQTNESFAGNMLQLQSKDGQKCLIMSSSAERSLTEEQRSLITNQFNNKIIAPPINMIETIGGGSARCMIAEVFDV